MPISFARFGLSAALLFTANTALRADDIPTPVDSAPGAVVSPATPATPSLDSNVPHLDSATPPSVGSPAPVGGPGFVGGALPGGDPMTGVRVGSPYYWSGNGGAAYGGYGYGMAPAPGFDAGVQFGGRPGCGCQGGGGGYAPGYGGYGYNAGYGYGAAAPVYGAPGYAGVSFYGAGNGAGIGGGYGGDPYYNHFGPGVYRNSDAGHYRFPYYSYRRPWYYPGHPSYNRDTNLPW